MKSRSEKSKNYRKQTNSESSKKKSKLQHLDTYKRALRNYWEGRPKTAIEELTVVLSSEINDLDAYLFYRLWIEILSQSEEVTSLRILQDHLNHRARVNKSSAIPFYSMSTLIHFVLDEYEACKLMLDSIKPSLIDPYYNELKQRYLFRVDPCLENILLHKNREELIDYFQLVHLSRSYLVLNKKKDISWTLDRIKSLYPKSPWLDFFKVHTYFDRNELEKAEKYAKKLVHNFPGNEIYRFQLGELKYKNKKYDDAVLHFKKLDQYYNQTDPEVLFYLGMSLSKSVKDFSKFYKVENPKSYLQKALKAYKKIGIPFERVSRYINMENKKDENKPNYSFKIWLYVASSRENLTLQASDYQSVKEIRKNFDDKVTDGDLVLFLSKSLVEGKSGYRLNSFYEVNGESVWHPLKGNINYMTLLDRFEFPVPIEEKALIREVEKRKESELFQKCKIIEANNEIFSGILDLIEDYITIKSSELEKLIVKSKKRIA